MLPTTVFSRVSSTRSIALDNTLILAALLDWDAPRYSAFLFWLLAGCVFCCFGATATAAQVCGKIASLFHFPLLGVFWTVAHLITARPKSCCSVVLTGCSALSRPKFVLFLNNKFSTESPSNLRGIVLLHRGLRRAAIQTHPTVLTETCRNCPAAQA